MRKHQYCYQYLGKPVLIGIAMTMVGCVSQSKFYQLAANHDTAVKERNNLASNNQLLNEQIKQLNTEQAQLKVELGQINDDLTQKKQALAILNEKFSATIQELNDVDAQLVAKSEQLDQTDINLSTVQQQLSFAQETLTLTHFELDTRTTELRKTQEYVDKTNQVYDDLVKNLTDELANNELTIKEMKDGITVELSQDILFPVGLAELNIVGNDVIGKVSDTLRDAPHQIFVAGFTDNRPITSRLAKKYPTNWELAGARAASVVRLLESNGVDSSQLAAVSYGENKPISANDTVDGRARNRRIEIRLALKRKE